MKAMCSRQSLHPVYLLQSQKLICTAATDIHRDYAGVSVPDCGETRMLYKRQGGREQTQFSRGIYAVMTEKARKCISKGHSYTWTSRLR